MDQCRFPLNLFKEHSLSWLERVWISIARLDCTTDLLARLKGAYMLNLRSLRCGSTPPLSSRPTIGRRCHVMAAVALALSVSVLTVAQAQSNDAVRDRMATVLPDSTPDAIVPSPVEGLVEVRYGSDIFYVTDDGRYLFQGALIDLETRENLTSRAQDSGRADLFAEMDDDQFTVYAPEGEVLHTVNIFTDPNCPFCRRQHEEMDEFLAAGVKVRYLIYPILGRESPQIMESIWCADDRNAAMDLAKAGRPVERRSCETPAEEHLALGRSLGIQGTPATVTDSGRLISGYRPAAEIIELLNR